MFGYHKSKSIININGLFCGGWKSDFHKHLGVWCLCMSGGEFNAGGPNYRFITEDTLLLSNFAKLLIKRPYVCLKVKLVQVSRLKVSCTKLQQQQTAADKQKQQAPGTAAASSSNFSSSGNNCSRK